MLLLLLLHLFAILLMDLVASRDLCLGGCAVPVEKASMNVLDPYGVFEGNTEGLDVGLVEFMASGNMRWLEKALNLENRWFVFNHHRIPLLLEILVLIRKKKIMRGAAARAPRYCGYLIALEVRGKILLFKNDTRYVCFADRMRMGDPAGPDEGLSDFNWFLNEMRRDVADLQEMDNDERADAKERRRGALADTEDQSMISDHLKVLRCHDNCSSATWYPSRNSFKVKREHDGADQSFRVRALKKRRKESAEKDDSGLVQRQFDVALALATSFLDHTGPGTMSDPEGPDDHAEKSADNADADRPESEPAGPSVPGREPAERGPSC